jgi:DNA invertase Pin-like site-specific DNA recombinase
MRIGVYARVSTTRQAEAQSTEQQLERLRAHVAAHVAEGWDLREEHIFRDDGYSGARLRRPGLDRLRDVVAAAALDRVLLTAPDRLARNYVHQMLLLDELQRGGCQVEFLERPMSQDPHDQLLLQIRGAVAEYERTLIAERMRRGRLRKLQAGVLLPWTRAPYGYRLHPERPRDPAGVRVEEAEAAVVRELFAHYLAPGGSLAGVAKRLFTLGVPTPTGKRCWHANTVRLILTNPTYTGQVYGGRSRARAPRQRWSALRPVRPDRACDEPLRCRPAPGSRWRPSRHWSPGSSSTRFRPSSPRTSNSPGAITRPTRISYAPWSVAASASWGALDAPRTVTSRPTPTTCAAGRRIPSFQAASRSARPASSLPPSSTRWSGPTSATC